MRIETDAIIPFSRQEVFAAYRDRLAELVPYLPNVRKIDVLERTDAPPISRLLNFWHAGGEMPAPARKLLGDGKLGWHDRAVWDESGWRCDWTITPSALSEAFECSGHDRFVALAEDRCRLEISGEMRLRLERVRGVPSMIAGPVGRSLELFLAKQITSNLATVSEGLTRLLGAPR
ncbi:MAG: hypothetical protein OEY14_02110 [Myxococcales bacterium]|nr:hypothetical protein [Myxococcales bacterium]